MKSWRKGRPLNGRRISTKQRHLGSRSRTNNNSSLGKSVTSTFLSTPNCSSDKIKEELLSAAEIGEVQTVKQILRENPNLDVSARDTLGRTPLWLAIANEHLEIVELLVARTRPALLTDALLFAISLDYDDIALIMLKDPSYKNASQDLNADSMFSAETTPLILAAQRNKYEIVSLLLHMGYDITMPHSHHCACNICTLHQKTDELRYSKARLNAYKGLSSESYICLSSSDPIQTAFNMTNILRKSASQEKHYRLEYMALVKDMRGFVIKLLDHVRGNEELDVILNVNNEHTENGNDLSTLYQAIKYNQKGFVAHPIVQKKINSLWYGDIRNEWYEKSKLGDIVLFASLSIFVPFWSALYWIYPRGRVYRVIHTPLVRFLGQTTSFLLFLLLIVTFSFTETPSHSEGGIPNITVGAMIEINVGRKIPFEEDHSRTCIAYDLHKVVLREYKENYIQVIICVFVIGFIWQECKQIYLNGFVDHFSSLFNILDFLSLMLYVASFTLRFLCYYKTWSALNHFIEKATFHGAYNGNQHDLQHAYWLVADRLHWSTEDPMNISEGLFSIANVLSFSRLFDLLAANDKLGPLQVSLNRMIMDIFKFLIIFGIVLIAFLVGLHNLYWYYSSQVLDQVLINKRDATHVSFGSLEGTFTTMFWSLFGFGEYTSVELESYRSGFTQRVGYFVFGAYNLIAVIVLLNMLIAMMSRSYESIQDDEDIEWKFAKAKLYIEFMKDSSFLVVPLNIIPSPASIYNAGRFVISLCYGSREQPPTDHHEDTREEVNGQTSDILSESLSIDMSNETDRWSVRTPSTKRVTTNHLYRQSETYQNIMKKIIARFILDLDQKSESPAFEGEMEEVRQDISGLKFDINSLFDSKMLILQQSIDNITARLDLQYPRTAKAPGPAPKNKARHQSNGRKNNTGSKVSKLHSFLGFPSSMLPSQRMTVDDDIIEEGLQSNLPPHSTNRNEHNIQRIAQPGYVYISPQRGQYTNEDFINFINEADHESPVKQHANVGHLDLGTSFSLPPPADLSLGPNKIV